MIRSYLACWIMVGAMAALGMVFAIPAAADDPTIGARWLKLQAADYCIFGARVSDTALRTENSTAELPNAVPCKVPTVKTDYTWNLKWVQGGHYQIQGVQRNHNEGRFVRPLCLEAAQTGPQIGSNAPLGFVEGLPVLQAPCNDRLAQQQWSLADAGGRAAQFKSQLDPRFCLGLAPRYSGPGRRLGPDANAVSIVRCDGPQRAWTLFDIDFKPSAAPAPASAHRTLHKKLLDIMAQGPETTVPLYLGYTSSCLEVSRPVQGEQQLISVVPCDDPAQYERRWRFHAKDVGLQLENFGTGRCLDLLNTSYAPASLTCSEPNDWTVQWRFVIVQEAVADTNPPLNLVWVAIKYPTHGMDPDDPSMDSLAEGRCMHFRPHDAQGTRGDMNIGLCSELTPEDYIRFDFR